MHQSTSLVSPNLNQKSLSLTMPELSCSFREHHHSTNFLQMDRKEADNEIELEITPKISQSTSNRKKSPKWSENFSRALSIKSEFMKTVILSNENSFYKAFVFIKNITKPHILAFGLTLLKIIVHNLVNQYCWLQNICKCNDNTAIKIYASLHDFFISWAFYCIVNLRTTSIFPFFQRNKYKKILLAFYFLPLFMSIVLYGVIIPEKDYDSIEIYVILMIFPFIFTFLHLFNLKFQFKIWAAQIIKSSSLNLFIFFNYALIRYCFPKYKIYLDGNFSEFWAKNLQQISNVVYFNFFFLGMKYLVYIFHENAIKQTSDYNVGRSLMRFALGFGFSMNFATLLRMEWHDLGGWLLLLLYIYFVVKTYLNFDIILLTYLKLINVIKKKKPQEEEIYCPEKTYFEKLYSGCMLDFQIIAISRIISWITIKRWFGIGFVVKFNTNCQLEISETFNPTPFGLFILIVVNGLMVICILAYMIKKKVILLEYKESKNFCYNIYFLFLLHSFFEACVQVSLFILT